MPLSPSLVGVTCTGPARPLTAADVARWADLPLVGVAGLGLPVLGALLVDPTIGLSMMRLAHGAHRLDVRRVPDVGEALETTATLAAIRPDPLGELLDVQLTTRSGGDIVIDATATLLLRGPRRRDGLVPPDALVATSPAGAVIAIATDVPIGAALAAALGDHNPIFVDDDAARQAGLPGPVLPHLGVLARAASAIGRPVRHLRGRFVRPALVGDTLRVTHWSVEDGVAFRVENQEAVVIIDDGHLGGGVA
jgi:hypothetical protein